MRHSTRIVLLAAVATFGTALPAGPESRKGQESPAVPGTVVFRRVAEPRENAFTLLVPKDWETEGGILRIDPTAQGGAAQSIDAKLDFAVKKDPAGTVMIRWLPELLYKDMRNAPARGFGMFPDGSNYMGMTVWPLVPAREYITRFVFPSSHPQARQVQVVEQRDLPDLARLLRQAQQAMMPGVFFGYDAALVRATYLEAGVAYEEVVVSAVEDWGQLGAGAWKNRSTFYARAPRGALTAWEPVFGVVLNSVKLNAQWAAGEIQGQITRGQIAQRTYSEIQRIGQEIVEHQQKTNAEIHNDVFLTLTEQEEYVNPYTNEVEVGSNQWKYRWVNESGEVIYTDVEEYDPNVDVELNRSDYERTPIRPRLPQ